MSKIVKRLLPLVVIGLATMPGLSLAQGTPITLSLLPLASSQQVQDIRVKMVTDMKFTPRAGASDDEVQQLRSKLGAVKMPLTVTMQLRQRLQAGAADTQRRIPVSARVESSTMELRNADGDLLPGAPSKGMPEMQFSALLVDGRYENIRWSGPTDMKMPPELLEKTFRKTFDALSKFEGAQLRVGESLELPLELNLPLPNTPAGSNAGKVNARYTLVKVESGVAFFDIAALLDFKMSLPTPPSAASAASSAPGAQAPASLSMVIKGTGTGRLHLRLADRLPLRNDLDMTVQMQMPLPEGHGMDMDMQVQVSSEGRAEAVAKGKAAGPKAKAAAPAKASS